MNVQEAKERSDPMSPSYRLDKWDWLTIRACKSTDGRQRVHRIMELRAMQSLTVAEADAAACVVLLQCLQARDFTELDVLDLILSAQTSEIWKYSAKGSALMEPGETTHCERFVRVLMSQVRFTLPIEWPGYPAPAKWRDDQP